jgi:hypothetical protein
VQRSVFVPEFLPGIALSRLFYGEVVRPILDDAFPGLAYSAALIGPGSDVLGYDTEMSTDHDWGPRLLLFLTPEDHARQAAAIRDTIGRLIPPEFRGYPTAYDLSGAAPHDGPSPHHVEVLTVAEFIRNVLAFDVHAEIEPADWLTFPEQSLRSITAGAVYHDGIGLEAVRQRFAYYPRDVWLYRLAAGWVRIAQEEHLMGRAGSVGDELGSSIIAARLVRDLMRLCFLMERQYAPYPKWFGTAFGRLACGADLTPVLLRVQAATTWQERDEHLAAAYEAAARMHNALGITDALPAVAAPFYTRPFRVIHAGGGFAGAICARMADPVVCEIAGRRLIGGVDQCIDSTDLLAPEWRPRLRGLYDAAGGADTRP